MNGVSTFRLYLLRATYLLIAVGLAFMIWPGLLNPPEDLEHMRGVVWSLLAGVSLLALIGIRYPLRMLPVLLFELVWKSVWLLAIGLPLWLANAFTAGTQETWNECLISIVLFLVVIPWRYLWTNYVMRPGDRWKSSSTSRITSEPAVSAGSPVA
jgi:hypothetical protein